MKFMIPMLMREAKKSPRCSWIIVHKYDPKGNGNITIGSNYMPWENAQKCADIVKVAGYNYAEKFIPRTSSDISGLDYLWQ